MNTKSKFAAALAVVALAASLTVPSSSAQAGKWGGVAAGFIGGAIVGSAIASHAYGGPVYVGGYRHCRWVAQYDQFGFYVGKVRVCHYH